MKLDPKHYSVPDFKQLVNKKELEEIILSLGGTEVFGVTKPYTFIVNDGCTYRWYLRWKELTENLVEVYFESHWQVKPRPDSKWID